MVTRGAHTEHAAHPGDRVVRSSLVRPSSIPSSACAWWTHSRYVPGATPIWRAVALIPRPPMRYSLTASVLNSGV